MDIKVANKLNKTEVVLFKERKKLGYEFQNTTIYFREHKAPVKLYQILNLFSERVLEDELNFAIDFLNPKSLEVGSFKFNYKKHSTFNSIINTKIYSSLNKEDIYSWKGVDGAYDKLKEISINKKNKPHQIVSGKRYMMREPLIIIIKEYADILYAIKPEDYIFLGLELLTLKGTYEYIHIEISLENALDLILRGKLEKLENLAIQILDKDNEVTNGVVTNAYLTEWGEEFETFGMELAKVLSIQFKNKDIEFNNVE